MLGVAAQALHSCKRSHCKMTNNSQDIIAVLREALSQLNDSELRASAHNTIRHHFSRTTGTDSNLIAQWVESDWVLLALLGPRQEIPLLVRGYARAHTGANQIVPHDVQNLIQRWLIVQISPDASTAELGRTAVSANPHSNSNRTRIIVTCMNDAYRAGYNFILCRHFILRSLLIGQALGITVCELGITWT